MTPEPRLIWPRSREGLRGDVAREGGTLRFEQGPQEFLRQAVVSLPGGHEGAMPYMGEEEALSAANWAMRIAQDRRSRARAEENIRRARRAWLLHRLEKAPHLEKALWGELLEEHEGLLEEASPEAHKLLERRIERGKPCFSSTGPR